MPFNAPANARHKSPAADPVRSGASGSVPRGHGLPTPYGLRVIESCLACVHREDRLFCRLSSEALGRLNAMRQNSLYPSGATLFIEGETPRGLFILCSGRAKLVASSPRGRNATLRFVESGEVLGLSSIVTQTPYPATAETLEPAQLSFIPRADFLRLLHDFPEVASRVAEHLSVELHKAWEQMRLLTLSPSSQAKLAQLLLTLAATEGEDGPEGRRLRLTLSQREIGETIAASRETVSRDLADFRRRGLIRTRGTMVVLLRPDELGRLGGG